MRQTRNLVYVQAYREFESHPARQILCVIKHVKPPLEAAFCCPHSVSTLSGVPVCTGHDAHVCETELVPLRERRSYPQALTRYFENLSEHARSWLPAQKNPQIAKRRPHRRQPAA